MAADTDGPGIATLRLPGVGHLLQWRSDGFWRELSDIQHQDEAAGLFTPDEDEWAAWTGSPHPHGRGGEWGEILSWWMVYGEMPDATAPTVELEDGTRPPVHVLGRIWACEWRAVAQPVTVYVAGKRLEMPFTEPMYRRRDGGPSPGPGGLHP